MKKFVESKRSWIEKHLQFFSEKEKLLQNTEPYTEEEIGSFVAKAKEIIPLMYYFYSVDKRKNYEGYYFMS